VAPARVLIVDDDPDIRALVMYRLTASGYDVICADDGETGLAAAREHAPDLLTARSDDVAMRGGWEAGIDEYITKPFSPRELVTRVEDILSRGR
jgi:DNA-binding response OmpR family regulator